MRAELSSIKLGDRVVYVVGGVEYNALALGTASEGWGQGIKLGSIFLTVTYLNELGVQVKVIAAPLLGVAADDEHLAAIAQQAAEKTFGYIAAHKDVRAQMVAEQLASIKANPRTNGWRPYVENEEVTTLRAQLAQANVMIGKLNDVLNQPPLDAVIGKLNDVLNQPWPARAFSASTASSGGVVVQEGDLFHPANPASLADVTAAQHAAAQVGSLADAPEDSAAVDPTTGDPTTDLSSSSELSPSETNSSGSAESTTQEADASLSQDQHAGSPQGGEAEDTNISASTETSTGQEGGASEGA